MSDSGRDWGWWMGACRVIGRVKLGVLAEGWLGFRRLVGCASLELARTRLGRTARVGVVVPVFVRMGGRNRCC